VEGDIELWDIWEKITCPVLCLRGGESDLLTAEGAKRMAETGPKAEVVTFPGIGHAPSLFEAGQIRLVVDWLRKQG
jgi:pimeloyl-ACP methyl ester carboxylesterase